MARLSIYLPDALWNAARNYARRDEDLMEGTVLNVSRMVQQALRIYLTAHNVDPDIEEAVAALELLTPGQRQAIIARFPDELPE